jgi:acyl-CoA:acyl-CoA alkyltransferase
MGVRAAVAPLAATPSAAPVERAAITGVGYATPARLVSSREVEARIKRESGRLPIPGGRLESISGIRSRYMVGPGEYASTLAIEAGRIALADAGVAPSTIDLLVFASASHDQLEPATAHIVAEGLGVNAPAFDAKNACNSFINGVEIAEAFIKTGRARRVLVVSGETPTLVTRWKVRSIGELKRSFIGYTMGDLGTAAVVEAATDGRGIFYSYHHATSKHWRIVQVRGGGARRPVPDPEDYFSEGDGTALRDAFLEVDDEHMARLFRETGTCWNDYAIVCAHQVAIPFIGDLVTKIGLPRDRLILTVDTFGNVSSGTLPLGLAIAKADGRVKPGDRVMWIGLGAGISVAALAFVL